MVAAVVELIGFLLLCLGLAVAWLPLGIIALGITIIGVAQRLAPTEGDQ